MNMSIEKLFSTKKAVAIGAAAVLTLGIAGTAFAYFTSTGTGTGAVSTGTSATNVSITDTSGSLHALAPGVAAQDFTVTATNPSANTQSAEVTTITAYLTVSGGTPVGGYVCSSADYYLDGTAGSTVGTPVTIAGWTATDLAPGASASTTGTNSIQFNDLSGQNQDSCESATVTINYASS